MSVLDYELTFFDKEWHVWTPDATGGILGSGPTKQAALWNAMDAMKNTREKMRVEADGLCESNPT